MPQKFAIGEQVWIHNPGFTDAIILAYQDGLYTVQIPEGRLLSGETIRVYPENSLLFYDYHNRLYDAGYHHDSRSCPVCQQQR